MQAASRSCLAGEPARAAGLQSPREAPGVLRPEVTPSLPPVLATHTSLRGSSGGAS